MAAVLQVNVFDILSDFKSEVGDSYRMVSVEQSRFNLPLCRLESSTGHVGFPDGFYLLQPILVAHLIKSIVDLVKERKKFLSFVTFHDTVELVDVDENYGNFTLFIRKVLFT